MYLLVLLIGIILIVLNVKAISKEKTDFDDVFKDRYNNIDEASLEIGKLRREFGETVFDLQKEILDLKKELDFYKDQDKNNNIINDRLLKDKGFDTLESDLSFQQLEDVLSDDIDDEEEYSDSLDKEPVDEESLEIYNDINFNNSNNDKNQEFKVEEKKLEENNVEEKNSSVKLEEIKKLLNQGLSVEEISEELNMGKGEVLLIIELYLK
ncbi:MAG: hypothetical protein AB6733_06145 [Clostridiaceae bacterium]